MNRLRAAHKALGEESGATIRADTAITTARTALSMLILSLAGAMHLNEDNLRGVIEPKIDPSTLQ